MTTAETICRRFRDDGTIFYDAAGVSLERACELAGADEEADGFDRFRYTFPDGSVITVAGEAWDLGFSACYCWQVGGHTNDCDDSA